jgi:hypothetical protein
MGLGFELRSYVLEKQVLVILEMRSLEVFAWAGLKP